MHSIGERLEEARKRKGISLREAAEATKIRSDYLGEMEQNKFDFELPEIYKRGFIKNYARFLKLDPEKILIDYSAVRLGNSRQVKRGGTELFGKMDAKSPPKQTAESTHENSYGRISSAPKPPAPIESDYVEHDDEPVEGESDKVFYMKVGLVCLGSLALVFVVFGLIKAILGSGSDEPIDRPELQTAEQAAAVESSTPLATQPPALNLPIDSITLTASGELYVLVQQQADKKTIYQGKLASGATISLDKQGPVSIVFNEGKNLTVEKDGEFFRPSAEGPARITIP
jgi:transcriptional regulator with XRE-family HTH domain